MVLSSTSLVEMFTNQFYGEKSDSRYYSVISVFFSFLSHI